MISRVLSAELPEHIGERVTIAGWLHRRRELKSVTFLIIRDRAGLAQVVLASGPASAELAGPEIATEETVLQVEGLVVANPQAPGGAELTEPAVTRLSGPVAAASVRPVPAGPDRGAADDPGPRAHDSAAPAAASRIPDRRGQRSRLPRRPRPGRIHRDLHAEDRRLRYRGRCQRVQRRLLRPARLPRSVAAVLQAGDGRRVRAGLRGRAGVPRRAARHRPAPSAVHEPGRRARVHHRPLRRDGRMPGGCRGHGRFRLGTG